MYFDDVTDFDEEQKDAAGADMTEDAVSQKAAAAVKTPAAASDVTEEGLAAADTPYFAVEDSLETGEETPAAFSDAIGEAEETEAHAFTAVTDTPDFADEDSLDTAGEASAAFSDDLDAAQAFDTSEVQEEAPLPPAADEAAGETEEDIASSILSDTAAAIAGDVPELSTAGVVEVDAAESDTDEAGELSTEDTAEDAAFTPKASADAVMGKKKKGGLDKNRIIGVAVIFISVFMTAAVVHLFWGDTKDDEAEKKTRDPSENQLANYENMASLIEQGELGNYDTGVTNEKREEEEPFNEDELPPIPTLDEPHEESEPVVPSGSGTVKARPDTSANRLQARTIQGIKGLSDSAHNTALAEANTQNTSSTNPYAQFGMPPKDEYMQQMLSMYGQQSGASYGTGNEYADQNGWQQKNNFYTQGRETAGQGQWLPPNTVLMGTIFTVELMNNINTDLPGSVTGRVTKNIYSADGKYLLIPQGSLVIGQYNSSISYAQSRVQVGWHTLIRPDLYQISLGNMEGTDAQGAAGIKGFINDHPLEYLKAFGFLSLVNLINLEFKNQIDEYADNEYVQNILVDAQSVTTQLGAKIVDRALNIQPTITIKAGTVINVVANTNLTLPVLDPYPVEAPYRRQ